MSENMRTQSEMNTYYEVYRLKGELLQLREQNRVLKKALAEIAMGNEVWERDQMIDCAEAALLATSQEGQQ